jgi:glutamate-ammonia-ligase adenylyltransferase
MESHNAPEGPHADAHIARAARLSRYAKRLLEAEPALGLDAETGRPFSAEEMRAFLQAQPSADEGSLKRALRALRKRVMLRLIARDLGGLAALPEVTATSTALAEITIAHALARLEERLAEQHGRPRAAADGRAQQLHVVGMGKLGGAELNVSSDIDLIFAYPEEGETQGPRSISNHEYHTLLGRRLIAALSEITADGYVFRVDMRLRPYGDAGPLVTSFEALENYFITQGREWERYAWIKARALTGDRRTELMELAHPFIYRRHMDYNAIAALRDLHGQIRREVERRDIADNIKLGPGGIREIEFIAQMFQLIRGGREPELRTQPTLAVLPQLAKRSLLPAAAAQELTAAYVFLRNLEHRLQYLDDQQTHALPRSEADRALIAEAMGFGGYAALEAALGKHRAAVTRHFEGIFAVAPETEHALSHLWQEAADTQRSVGVLAGLGFREPDAVEQRLRSMRSTSRYREMPAAAQALLDRLVPLAVEAAAARKDPDATLERLIGLLESIARRGAYLALLKESLGRPVPDQPSHPPRRAARRAHPLRRAELALRGSRAARTDGRRRRRHREADGHPAALQARAYHASHRAGPGGPAADRDAERPPERSRVRGARGRAARHVAVAPDAPRDAALRGDRLRQARRQGTRIRLGSRPRIPPRRPGAGSRRELRAARAAHQ